MAYWQRSHCRLILLIISICSFLASLANPALAAVEQTVEARGMAQLSGRKDLAREQALSEAFRQAVRQALGVMVESESLVRNKVVVTDLILSRSNGLIKKYSIISETEGDGTYPDGAADGGRIAGNSSRGRDDSGRCTHRSGRFTGRRHACRPLAGTGGSMKW